MRKSSWFGIIYAGIMLIGSAPEGKAQFLPGGVFVCANCADEPTTLAIKAEQLLQYAKEVETALNTYRHLELFIREIQQLAQHPSTNIASDLGLFASIVQQSQALAMDAAAMNTILSHQFGAYVPNQMSTYAAQYSTWAGTALAGIQAAATAAASQGDMLKREQFWMETINGLTQGTNGMDQSLQIQNSIGLETVAQLQRLRTLLVALTGQNTEFYTTLLNTQQANVSVQAGLFNDTGLRADQRGW